jgi:hypothetical protein
VRVTTLAILRDRELSLHEIVRLTGKAKFTVSAHLKFLIIEGIIGENAGMKIPRLS